ncbi:amidase domain-containing protein [Dysosmobacter welbionis]|uniref:amidase domain-containing protein n=1 Tax=Dysosmobacter welbionis TaxID=2093857 RepID=UPI002357DADB|nr:amidase domain-containing protein [Dysosmobacter welbionis]
MRFALYDRRAAVLYAHRWAYGRNPAFYDYEHLGGDCTNFASQCIYAGSGVMNFTPTFGWYYIDPDQKAPAWTGVPYLYNFLVREEKTEGPAAHPCELRDLRPGDLIQLSFDGENFRHTPVVVSVGPKRASGLVERGGQGPANTPRSWHPNGLRPSRRAPGAPVTAPPCVRTA